MLQHVPDLVRYGSKPLRSPAEFADKSLKLRMFDEAVRYPPNHVFIGAEPPQLLEELPRPWSQHCRKAISRSPYGELIGQRAFYELMADVDQFNLVGLDAAEDLRPDWLRLTDEGHDVGVFRSAHEIDESLSASVLLENLSAKASGVHALRFMLSENSLDPAGITYVLGAGEEAIGDRYQRGGGGLGRAVAETCGLTAAGGADVKAFCAGPIHALTLAASLVASGLHDQVAIVAGGSLAKLGMKFLGALQAGTPVLEDTLAGMAILVGTGDSSAPRLRLDAAGATSAQSGHSQQALLTQLVTDPLARVGLRMTDVETYATELHNPEITEPAGSGNVPDRNYRMLAGLAVTSGAIERSDMESFAARHGLPGFSPTQGHIASAVPWVPHAIRRFTDGELSRTMLIAKGSLFLGRLTHAWDGASILLEVRE